MLDVLQSSLGNTASPGDGVQPLLHMIGSDILQQGIVRRQFKLCRLPQRLEITMPDLVIATDGTGPLVLCDKGQVLHLAEVRYCRYCDRRETILLRPMLISQILDRCRCFILLVDRREPLPSLYGSQLAFL